MGPLKWKWSNEWIFGVWVGILRTTSYGVQKWKISYSTADFKLGKCNSIKSIKSNVSLTQHKYSKLAFVQREICLALYLTLSITKKY